MQQYEKTELTHDDKQDQVKRIHFPEGLPGFESIKDFVLLTNEEEAPFLWLQSTTIPNLAFISVDPFLVMSDYRPDIGDEDVEFLEIEKEEDVLILSIVNISNDPNEGTTANLVGPIVINWKTKRGKQVILQNHQEFSVKFRIDQLDQ
ncbi:Flagellar assembly factor FliW [Chlamydiales bacterium SCGC AG-110-M15]|nr:Flagellar assembly factor FliW [Chlamydiales bacterium SCGC AG-110-M15]